MLIYLQHILIGIPPLAIYLMIAGIVLVESMGIPLPGETVLMAAAVLSASKLVDVSPMGIALAGATGAIVGDSIAYWIGHRYGNRLLRYLHRHFPKHIDAVRVAWAEQLFARWGFAAVFFGRFVALLRMFAGPISGLLRMTYPVFLAANALGGIAWSFGATWLVYLLGLAAERYLKDTAWILLIAAIVVVVIMSLVLNKRQGAMLENFAQRHPAEVEAATERLR